MDTSAKVGLSLSLALFIVLIILIILLLWSYYSIFQKDSYFFDLVGPADRFLLTYINETLLLTSCYRSTQISYFFLNCIGTN